MTGLVAYAGYVPYYRLDRAQVQEVLGRGGGQGERAVASYDEDTTTMAVAAAADALLSCGRTDPRAVDELLFATTTPPYLEKSNAATIHAALRLHSRAAAAEAIGPVGGGASALRRGADAATLGRTAVTTLADIRTGRPGSGDEAMGGDAAAAFVWSTDGDPIAHLVATTSFTVEMLDRWRLPDWQHSRVWDDRFVEAALRPVAAAAAGDALAAAGVRPDEVGHLVISSARPRVAASVRKDLLASGVPAQAGTAVDLRDHVGFAGAADLGLGLAQALDAAVPDEIVLAVVVAEGAQALVLRTAPGLSAYRPTRRLQEFLDSKADLAYSSFLSWRGFLDLEPPRRPEAAPPAGPPSLRGAAWKFGFVGAQCGACGTRQLPPGRVCANCGAVDQMSPLPFARTPGRITTYTIDHLSPQLVPTVGAIVDFDGGGRAQLEVTDADPTALRVGDSVEMTFRRLHTSGGVHNYFWKARPPRNHEKEDL